LPSLCSLTHKSSFRRSGFGVLGLLLCSPFSSPASGRCIAEKSCRFLVVCLCVSRVLFFLFFQVYHPSDMHDRRVQWRPNTRWKCRASARTATAQECRSVGAGAGRTGGKTTVQRDIAGENMGTFSATMNWLCVTMPRATWTRYNATVRRIVGDGNDLLFHFIRWLGVWLVIAVFVALIWPMRLLVASNSEHATLSTSQSVGDSVQPVLQTPHRRDEFYIALFMSARFQMADTSERSLLTPSIGTNAT